MRSHISPSLPLRLVIGDNLVVTMFMTSQVFGDAVTGPITQTTVIPAIPVLESSSCIMNIPFEYTRSLKLL